MMTKHLLSLACLASLVGPACKGKDSAPSATSASAAKAAAAPATAPLDAKLAAAIKAANACEPDDECPARDDVEEAVESLSPAQYRTAIALTKNADVRRTLNDAVAPKLDEPLLLELEQRADACPADDECQAEDDFTDAISELTPALFQAGMKAAKTSDTRHDLLVAIRRKMAPSLIPAIEPWLADPDVGTAAQQTLGAIEDTAALAKLAALLDRHDRTDTIHSQVPSLLAKYPSNPAAKAALPQLRAMAQHDHQGWGKANAAVAVAKIEGPAAIPFLLDFLHTETWGPARTLVAEALGAFKTDKIARTTLEKLAKDADKGVAAAAAKALKAS